MSMQGKRFGTGLLAGVLLGLLVVAASTGTFVAGLSGSLSSAPGQPVANASSTIAKAVTTATTSSATQTGQPPPQSGLNSTSGAVSNLSTTTNPTSMLFAASGVSTHGFSSQLASLAQQPLLTNAIIFVPVLVAFLLGAVLYVASTRGRADGRREESAQPDA